MIADKKIAFLSAAIRVHLRFVFSFAESRRDKLVSRLVKKNRCSQYQPPASSRDSGTAGWGEKVWCSGWLFVLLIAVAAFAAYQPVWHAGFIWDDDQLLAKNALIHQADGWRQVWTTKGTDYVPATLTNFWLEWRVWKDAPLGYHLDNVLLHALGAILVWRVLLRLQIPGARLAAAIFALHPVAVESVAWISERKNTLALVFYACALLWYLTFEDTGKWRWYWLAAAGFAAGIFSKTAVAPLPLVLLGMAWWRRGKIERRDLERSALFFFLAAGASVLAIWIQRDAAGAIVRPDDFWLRLAGAGRAIWFYLGKTLVPLNLSPVYPLWRLDETNWVTYLPALAVVATMTGLFICRARGGRALLAGFGYFVVLLLPVLGFVDITLMRCTLVADQWAYFAIIGPISLAAAGIVIAIRRFARMKLLLQMVICVPLLGTLGLLTWKQSRIYTSPASFWQATLAADPKSFLARCGLGDLLYQSGKAEEAIYMYKEAMAIEPGFYGAHLDLAMILEHEGSNSEAIGQYLSAVKFNPDCMPACNNAAWLLATSPRDSDRDGAKAIDYARQAVRLSGGSNATVIGTLAAAYAEAGRFPEAVAAAQQALNLASQKGDSALARDLSIQLELYRKGSPYRK